MRKKSFAATITIIFCAIFVSVIGSTFATYLQRKNIIKIDNPKVVAASGITIYNEKNQQVREIELSDMKLGLKPVTGEDDVETEIPSTVTSSVGSEGYYAKFKLTSQKAFKIYVTDIEIEAKQNKEAIKNERENIKVALQDVPNSTKNLVDDKVLLLTSNEGVNKKEYILYIWLTSNATDVLKGAKINFSLMFE